MNNSIWQNIRRNLLTALIGVVPGMLIILVALGVIPVEADELAAPLWLLFGMGGVFILAGISALGINIFSDLTRNIIGGMIIGIFYVTALWIAFGPGERVFIGADPLIGRTAFGISSLLVFFMLIIALRMIATTVHVAVLMFLVSVGTILLVGYWWL